jgi:hypothetical protein
MAAPVDALSPVGLCCRAFDAIEHRSFEDFADGTEEGAFAARHYDQARRFVLTAAPWSFAEAFARADGALAGVVAPDATPYVVALAPDCLRFRHLCDIDFAHRAAPFGDRRLRTDVAPPFVYSYTADVVDPYAFSPGAAECLVTWLAHLFAPKFARSAGLAERLLARFERLRDDAAAADAAAGAVADHRLGGIADSWTRAMTAAP